MADEDQNGGTGSEGQSDQDGSQQGNDHGDQNQNAGQGAGTGGNQDGDGDNNESNQDNIAKAEYDQVHARMVAADRRASEAERKLKEIADKDKSELDRAKEAKAAADTERDSVRAELAQTKLHNAFLSNTDIIWNDPADALTLANLAGVVGDDGTIDEKLLKTRISDLAKKKPYLVKPTTEASGSGGNGGRKGTGDQQTKDQLAKRFPALNHR